MNGLPERIKVTISREDGSPVSVYAQTPQVLYLDKAAPALVIMREGGTLRVMQSDLNGILDFIEDLTETD